jgi:hypothetical protein
VVAAAITGIAVTSLVLGLANHHGKPSGVGELWPRELSYVSERSIWRDSRSEAQVRFRSGAGDNGVVRYFNERVPAAATVALAVKSDDFISPYFGPRLSRRVWLVRDRERVPVGADWLVLSPTMRASRCREAWEQVFSHRSGWRIERRTAADACGEEERAR